MESQEVTIRIYQDSDHIEVDMKPFTVVAGGEDRKMPSPGNLFVSGALACAASSARGYCVNNHLPVPVGAKASIRVDPATNIIQNIDIHLILPPDFPKDRIEALERATGKCTVKKWWTNPPEFSVDTSFSK